mmetsp:Transcript_21979/g.68789  ORF Transcript_21979/g.68789 Transcript_21979/m.68789 type:complete len:411 (-) Transcript_21979:302-1534(-)
MSTIGDATRARAGPRLHPPGARHLPVRRRAPERRPLLASLPLCHRAPRRLLAALVPGQRRLAPRADHRRLPLAAGAGVGAGAEAVGHELRRSEQVCARGRGGGGRLSGRAVPRRPGRTRAGHARHARGPVRAGDVLARDRRRLRDEPRQGARRLPDHGVRGVQRAQGRPPSVVGRALQPVQAHLRPEPRQRRRPRPPLLVPSRPVHPRLPRHGRAQEPRQRPQVLLRLPPRPRRLLPEARRVRGGPAPRHQGRHRGRHRQLILLLRLGRRHGLGTPETQATSHHPRLLQPPRRRRRLRPPPRLQPHHALRLGHRRLLTHVHPQLRHVHPRGRRDPPPDRLGRLPNRARVHRQGDAGHARPAEGHPARREDQRQRRPRRHRLPHSSSRPQRRPLTALASRRGHLLRPPRAC